MEQLLFILFILFSLFSWLMERRKRKRKKQLQEQGQTRSRGEGQETVDEQEDEGAWPFPVDPFEPETRKSSRVDVLVDYEAEAEHQAALEERERAQEDQQVKSLARQAEELERRARQVQPKRRIQEMVREKMDAEAQNLAHGQSGMDFRLNPKKARLAIVYAEILGPPKSERREEE
jgi:hypothetical protein